MTDPLRPRGAPPLTIATFRPSGTRGATARRALVLTLSLAAVLAHGGCRRVEPQAPIRLVEHQEGTTVRWPRARTRRPPRSVPASALGALPAPGAVREVVMYGPSLDYDSRAALLLPHAARYRFEITPPAGSELRLALGYVITEAAQGELRYRVRAAPGDGDGSGDFTTLLDERVDTEINGRWRERRISLADWEGRPIVLGLRILASGGGGDGLWGAFATPEILTADPPRKGPDVILISLDTLRADHLSAYGYERPTSPNLDALAAGGYRFDTAVSQAPWTRPSHRSMLRGQYPLSHGPIAAPPLPLTLWRAGYRTAAFTGGGQMSFRFGFHEGFETFRQIDWVRSPATVTDWIDADPERSFFLLLHTFEIHDPYDHSSFAEGLPSGRFRPGYGQKRWWSTRDTEYSQAEKDYVEALYDSGILFTDEALGRLFAALRDRGLFERAIVIVTSDHGEQFWDHGSWRHGSNVYDEMLLVPLIVHLPPGLGAGEPGRIIRQQVALVDLVPTVLDLLDLPPPEGVQGRSLRPLLEGAEPAEPVPAFAEHTNTSRESKALRAGRLKLIYSYPRSGDRLQPQSIELYDLDADPGETRNLARDQPPLARLLEAELKAILLGAPAPTFDEEVPADIDPELRRELEALGYLDP